MKHISLIIVTLGLLSLSAQSAYAGSKKCYTRVLVKNRVELSERNHGELSFPRNKRCRLQAEARETYVISTRFNEICAGTLRPSDIVAQWVRSRNGERNWRTINTNNFFKCP